MVRYHKEPYEVLRERIHEEQRRYREVHKEWLKQYNKKYRNENQEKFLESKRRYRHSEKGIQTAKEYYSRQDVKDRIYMYQKKYREQKKI